MPKYDLTPIQKKLDANQPLPNESRPHTKHDMVDGLTADHPIHELWFRLSEMYGHKWSSQYGDSPTDTWIRALDGLSGEQFSVGLGALLRKEDTWPPTLVEFRQLCLNADPGRWERRAHKIYEPDRKLEDITGKEKSAVEGKKTLDELKWIFK